MKFLKELWDYRELLYFLAWRDVKIRYKQAALGMAWAVMQPLFTMVVFTIFFGRFAKIPSDGVPYPLFSYSALLLWTYFSVTLGLAGNSLIGNSNLITKVYFPRLYMPVGSALAGLLDIIIGSSFLIALMIYYGVPFHAKILITPLFVILLFFLTTSISLILAAMNVKYRDVKYVIPFMTQIWLFLTPIIYPVSFLPERYQWLLALNPVTGIIEGFRACLLEQNAIPWNLVGTSALITAALMLFGTVYFRKTEKNFADVV